MLNHATLIRVLYGGSCLTGLPEDTYTDADQILARTYKTVFEGLMDESKIPFLGSIPHASKQMYKRKIAVLCSYPTPLVGKILKTNLIIDGASDRSKPGGQVKIILEALSRMNPGKRAEENKSLWRKFKDAISRSGD